MQAAWSKHYRLRQEDEMTEPQRLAEEYLRLGGTRKSKVDDNIINVRQWDGEPDEAERFWQDNIERLGEEERAQVILFLPSISPI